MKIAAFTLFVASVDAFVPSQNQRVESEYGRTGCLGIFRDNNANQTDHLVLRYFSHQQRPL